MPASSIQLGPVTLQDFEVPESVRFGGSHRLTVHKLAGGKRIVERLGPDDDDIRFHGIFTGPTAEDRVRAVDDLRLSGEIVWLTWETFRYRVIVKKFVVDFHSPWWIAYQATCIAINQETITPPIVSLLAAQVSSDLANALLAATGSTISLTSLRTALAAPNVLTASTADQAQAAAEGVSALAAIDDQISGASATLTTTAPPNANMIGLGQQLSNRITCAGFLASAVNTRSYVGRIAKNLASLGT